MSDHINPPPGWYPDPEFVGPQRYWDGAAWTPHRSDNYLAGPANSSKGAKFGRPQEGSGSLAHPGKRLGARLLDGLIMAPVFILLAVISVILIAPHAGPMFPKTESATAACRQSGGDSCANSNNTSDNNQPTPGFVWIYFGLWGAGALTGIGAFFYESIATAKYGRTLGKAWMHIRPLKQDGTPLAWGRSFGRTAMHLLISGIPYAGILDPLWCLWDDGVQCLHDKVVDTIVVSD